MSTHKVLHMPIRDPIYNIFMYTIYSLDVDIVKNILVLCIEVVHFLNRNSIVYKFMLISMTLYKK